jgi:H+/Cl- antiporter ClcA
MLFSLLIVGMCIYNIATQPHNKPVDWLVPVVGIVGGLCGMYVSVKLMPKEPSYMSAKYARLAKLKT